jgi:peptide/nickel transport system substrate-binding protein
LIAACAPPSSPAPGGASGTAPGAPTVAAGAAKPGAVVGEPQFGGRVILGSIADAKVLSPVHSTDVTSSDVHGRIYESLTQLDPKTGEATGRLAEKFEVSPDNKSITFTLRDGLKWSDGSAFSGDDFAFTAEAVMRSKSTVRKNIFQDIVGAKDYADGKAESISGIQVNGKNITVQLSQPYCPAVNSIGGFGIMPRSVFGRYMDPKDANKNIDEAPELRAPPIAIGPYKFKEWVPNDHITLTRNDGFYLGKPYLDEWVNKVYPDANATTAALKTGEIDVATVEPKDLEDLKALPNLKLYSYLATGYTYIGWNQLRGGKEFLQSKPVRQALAYGLNMDQVIEKVLFGEGRRQLAHTPPVLWAYDPAGLNDYKYDPAKAEQLLQSDGWAKGADGVYQKNGTRLEFSMVTNSGNKVRETLLQVAVEQYKQIGINVTPLTEAFEKLVDRTDRSRDPVYGDQGGRDFDAVILGWANLNEPDAYTIWHSSSIPAPGFNTVGYKSAAVDQALVDGRTMCGTADRKAAYKTMNQQLNEDQPYNFGFAANTLLFVQSKFQGVEPSSFRRLAQWNIEKWWIKS